MNHSFFSLNLSSEWFMSEISELKRFFSLFFYRKNVIFLFPLFLIYWFKTNLLETIYICHYWKGSFLLIIFIIFLITICNYFFTIVYNPFKNIVFLFFTKILGRWIRIINWFIIFWKVFTNHLQKFLLYLTLLIFFNLSNLVNIRW